MKAINLEEVESFIFKDPINIAGVQEYHIVEFKLHDCQSMVKESFKD